MNSCVHALHIFNIPAVNSSRTNILSQLNEGILKTSQYQLTWYLCGVTTIIQPGVTKFSLKHTGQWPIAYMSREITSNNNKFRGYCHYHGLLFPLVPTVASQCCITFCVFTFYKLCYIINALISLLYYIHNTLYSAWHIWMLFFFFCRTLSKTLAMLKYVMEYSVYKKKA